MKHKISIVPFEAQYAEAFAQLNFEWLERYFVIEPYDRKVLTQAQTYILDPGGVILFALADQEVVGTLALINRGEEGLELSKMAVTEKFQGLRIGQRLMYAAIHQAGEMGTHRLFLDSNTKLSPAITLYHKVGFKEVPLEDTPYERGNIRMEIRM